MNEAKIRDQLQEAIGEANYPPALATHVQARFREQLSQGHPHAIGIIAALLALAVVSGLVFTRIQLGHISQPATPISSRPAVSATSKPVNPNEVIPGTDLEGANLGNAAALVTRLNLVANDGDADITLFGAYADHARTVLFFRTVRGSVQLVNTRISDQQGWLNSASSGGSAVQGDTVFILWSGPRSGADGVAHLAVTLYGYVNYAFDLKVQPSIAVQMSPPLTSLGPLKFNSAAVEVTPSVIYFHAVTDQVSESDKGQLSIDWLDASGHSLQPFSGGGGYTSAHSLQPISGESGIIDPTRVGANQPWTWESVLPRPAGAQTYELQITIHGSVYRTQVLVDAPVP